MAKSSLIQVKDTLSDANTKACSEDNKQQISGTEGSEDNTLVEEKAEDNKQGNLEITKRDSVNLDHAYVKCDNTNIIKKKCKRKMKRKISQHGSVARQLIGLSTVSYSSSKLTPAQMIKLRLSLKMQDARYISKCFMAVPGIHNAVVDLLCDAVGERPNKMKN